MALQEISVTKPLSQAIERVKTILFRPFSAGKWFTIGFCAWLAALAQGGGFNGGYNFGSGKSGPSAQGVQREFEQARDYVVQNLTWIIPVALTLILLAIAIWLLVIWLSSRGQFMFLHCVALNKGAVREPWHKYAREGNSLFVFRLILGVCAAISVIPLVVAIGFVVFGMMGNKVVMAGSVMLAIGLGLLTAALGVFWFVVGKLTRDFVVPIQFSRGIGWREGWRIFMPILFQNFIEFLLYFLFQLLIAIVISVVLIVVVLVTCCIAGCLFSLPYLGTVFLLPVYVFWRSYSLYYLAQFGPEFDVISNPPPQFVQG